jgi:hypothetical protein
MKWVTREDVKVGRIACVWVIRRFIDPQAEIVLLPGKEVVGYVEREGAIPFHVPRVEFAHTAGKTPFEAIIETYGLMSNPAMALLGRIVNGADTDNRTYNQPEGPGLRAITEGLRGMFAGNDEEILARGAEVFDAMYTYCVEKAGEG